MTEPWYWAASYRDIDESQQPFDELQLMLESSPELTRQPLMGVRCVVTIEGARPRIGLVAVVTGDGTQALTPAQLQQLKDILHDGMRFELSVDSLERLIGPTPAPQVQIVDSLPAEETARA